MWSIHGPFCVLAIKIIFPEVKITYAAPDVVPVTIPDSCDSEPELRNESNLAFPILNEDETFLDNEALDEILFDALRTL